MIKSLYLSLLMTVMLWSTSQINSKNSLNLKLSLQTKNINSLKRLLDNGLFVDTLVEVEDMNHNSQKLPLFYYILKNHPEFSEAFLDYKPSVIYPKYKMLEGSYLATYLNTKEALSLKVFHYLLDKGEKITDEIYINFLDQSSIYQSKVDPKIHKHRLKIFNLLFDKVSNPLLKGRGTSRIEILATVRGDKVTLDKLFKKGFNPNAIGHIKMSHFEGSVTMNDLDLFKRLLAEGGELFKPTPNNRTVFSYIVQINEIFLQWLFENKREIFENMSVEEAENILSAFIKQRRYSQLPESLIFLLNNVPKEEELLKKLFKIAIEEGSTSILKQLMFLKEGLLNTSVNFLVSSIIETEKHIQNSKNTKHHKSLLNVIFIDILFETRNINNFLLSEEKLELLKKYEFDMDAFLKTNSTYISSYMKRLITNGEALKVLWLLIQGFRVTEENQNYYVESNYMRGLIDRANMGVKTLGFRPRGKTETEALHKEIFFNNTKSNWYQKHAKKFREKKLKREENNISSKPHTLSHELTIFKTKLLDLISTRHWDKIKTLIEKQNDLSALNESDSMFKIIYILLRKKKFEHLSLMIDKKLSIPIIAKRKNKDLLTHIHKRRKWQALKFLMTKGGFAFDRMLWMKKDDYRHYRPLISVISQEDIETLKWAIKNKIPIKEKYYKKESPLMVAVLQENLKIIKLLIKAGANPKHKMSTGNNAIALSQNTKNKEITNYFTSMISASTFNVSMLNAVIKKQKIILVKRIINSGIDANKESKIHPRESPLKVAIDVGNIEILEYLLSQGVDVNKPFGAYKHNALYEMYSAKNAVSQIDIALKYGALAQTPNSDYNILEQVFYSAYKPEITRLFIENNVSLTTPINEKGQLVIHALLNQTGEKTWGQFIINKMVKEGNIKALSLTDTGGNSLIHYATSTNKPMIVKSLLKLGVNAKAMNKKNVQAIAYASTKELLNILEPHSDHQPSISDSYCMVYVEKGFDKSKVKYCQTTAKYYESTKNHAQAIWYYFLANDLEAIKKYTQDMTWVKKADCNCDYPDYYTYLNIGNAYLLSGDRKNAKKYYKILAEFMKKDSRSKAWIVKPLKVLEGLHSGYKDKAKRLLTKIWKEKYKKELF